LKNQVHAVLAAAGVPVAMSDVFGLEGSKLLDRVELVSTARARVDSARRLIDMLDFEIDTFSRLAASRLRRDEGYRAVQTIPGIGEILGAIFVAEIGDISRFARPEQLTSWAGLTPRHHESDTTIHRGRITKQGSRLVRWAAVESVQRVAPGTRVGARRERVAARRCPGTGSRVAVGTT
jgi:transposase